jgi:hypothetical protein
VRRGLSAALLVGVAGCHSCATVASDRMGDRALFADCELLSLAGEPEAVLRVVLRAGGARGPMVRLIPPSDLALDARSLEPEARLFGAAYIGRAAAGRDHRLRWTWAGAPPVDVPLPEATTPVLTPPAAPSDGKTLVVQVAPARLRDGEDVRCTLARCGDGATPVRVTVAADRDTARCTFDVRTLPADGGPYCVRANASFERTERHDAGGSALTVRLYARSSSAPQPVPLATSPPAPHR